MQYFHSHDRHVFSDSTFDDLDLDLDQEIFGQEFTRIGVSQRGENRHHEAYLHGFTIQVS
jgi:hypothetical protein